MTTPNPPDWRGLCSRMADELDHYRQLLADDRREVHPLAVEARLALAQPEPEVVGPTPSEQLVEQWVAEVWHEGTPVRVAASDLRLAARAADWGARWGRPAPAPAGEVEEAAAWLRAYRDEEFGPRSVDPDARWLTRAADLLEQQATAYAICERERLHQSTRAADLEIECHPAPVPVAERLPGPEDCDAELYCWRWNTIGGLWARQPLARSWYEFESHWLPFNALPLPQGGQ